MNYKYEEKYKRCIGENNWIRKIIVQKRLSYILNEIEILKSHLVLDVGCAGGLLSYFLLKHASKVYGIDVNHHIIIKSNGIVKGKFICGDAIKMPFKSNSFDIVICSHLLEHIPSPFHCIKEINKISKPGAKIIVIYPIELFRGFTCIPDVLLSGQPLTSIRKIHLHKLSLSKMKNFVEGTDLKIIKHKIIFALLPMYMTVLTKSNDALH